jgi:hypothetical protein
VVPKGPKEEASVVLLKRKIAIPPGVSSMINSSTTDTMSIQIGRDVAVSMGARDAFS